MPLSVETLTPDSSPEEIKAKKSESIAQCINEGREQDQCVAIVSNYIREKTQKSNMNLGLSEAFGGK